MTREEYLDILQNNLHGIPPQEAENIMEYYREYFDDAGVENAEKVMQELGAPEQLAKRAAADAAAENGFAGAAGSGQNPGFGSDNGQTAAKKKHTAAGITLAVITSPIWASRFTGGQSVCCLSVVITVAAVVLVIGICGGGHGSCRIIYRGNSTCYCVFTYTDSGYADWCGTGKRRTGTACGAADIWMRYRD